MPRKAVKKQYSVEVYDKTVSGNAVFIAKPCVIASNPLDAVIYAMQEEGYVKSRTNIAPYDNKRPTHLAIAKVCLLGGTRESVSYYEVG